MISGTLRLPALRMKILARSAERDSLSGVCRLSDAAREETTMSVERLQRFAAECVAVADGTRNPKEKEVWMGLAQRWLTCAALLEREEADLRARARKGRETIH